MVIIDMAVLARLKACQDQVCFFQEIFGDRAEVSESNIIRAREEGLGVIWLATHPDAPPEILQAMSVCSDERIRRYVGQNPSTPPDVLRVLAEDPDETVRRSVAENQSTPPEVLRTLAADENWMVRLCANENPTLLAEELSA